VSAVGHEQDTPLCDLAADVRASTPTAAGRLVVPDARELRERLDRARNGIDRGVRTSIDRSRTRLVSSHDRLRHAPMLALERKRARLEHAHGRLRTLSPRATVDRGYAIVRRSEQIVRSVSDVTRGAALEIEVADGSFGAHAD
jgi:exodeoxyribonuclease VII large subunit